MTDLIAARATPAGRAAVSVIRVSGPGARKAVEALAGPLPESGRRLRWLRDRAGEPIDQALILTFPSGASFTGEETAEIQGHGSPAAEAAILRSLVALGVRPAEPGEFARRAFDNGRIDLAQIEGLADLIEAETEAQRRQALRALSGALGERVAQWRARLLEAEAWTAAAIDFADEEIPDDVLGRARAVALGLCDELLRELDGAKAAERVRTGFEVAIVGAPNVGKSTLLNRMAGREVAITSRHAGTTRDVIEVRMDLGGLPVTLLDTAGLRETADEVEQIGIARAQQRAAQADLRVHLVGPDGASPLPPVAGDIVVRAKGDLHPGPDAVSGLTGAGVDRLCDEIARRLGPRVPGAAAAVGERQQAALGAAIGHLRSFATLAEMEVSADLAAEELRLASRAIESLVGRIEVEDVLGQVFSRLCIGK